MTSDVLLKDRNKAAIAALFLVHGLVFIAVAFGHTSVLGFATASNVQEQLSALIGSSVSFAVVVALVKLVVLGQVSDRWRDRIVHWRWSNAKPASRAFTEIGPDDDRVCSGVLEGRYGTLPSSPKEQNRLWYQISLEYQYEPGVRDAHRNYLAARDLALISALIIPFSIPALWLVTRSWTLAAGYGVGLVGAYCVITISAQNYGRRFVENVLAVATAKNARLSTTQPEVRA